MSSKTCEGEGETTKQTKSLIIILETMWGLQTDKTKQLIETAMCVDINFEEKLQRLCSLRSDIDEADEDYMRALSSWVNSIDVDCKQIQHRKYLKLLDLEGIKAVLESKYDQLERELQPTFDLLDEIDV